MSDTSASGRKCLVTALGTGANQEVGYVLDGKKTRSRYSAVAVGHLAFETGTPLTVVTLLTKAARETHGERFRAEIETAGWEPLEVDIPDGRTEKELWSIFEAVGSELREGDEVVLDPTHGFRSIQIIMLSALQYYRIQKRLKLVSVYYGAYEPGQPEAPMFNLTPIIGLADWAYGVKIFREHQIATPLGERLEQLHTSAYADTNHTGPRPTRLKDLGQALKKLDLPLRYALPIETGWAAHELVRKATSAEEEVVRLSRPCASPGGSSGRASSRSRRRSGERKRTPS